MTTCKEWSSARNNKGYGVRSHPDEPHKLCLAHRLAYCVANGVKLSDIKGKLVRHTCDNPPCVEPEHLVLGTQKDNIQDCSIRGRIAKTERKLTEGEADYIRRIYGPTLRAPALGRMFKVSGRTVLRIVNNQTYVNRIDT